MYTMSMTVTNMQPFWHKIEHCESKGCPTWRIVEWVSRLWHDTCTSGLENPKSWDFFVGLSTLSLPGWSQNLMDKTHSNWVLSTKPRPCDFFLPHLGFLLLQQTPALEHLMSDLCRPKQSKMCFKGWFLTTWRQVPQAPQVPLFGYAFRGHSFPSHLLGSRSFNNSTDHQKCFWQDASSCSNLAHCGECQVRFPYFLHFYILTHANLSRLLPYFAQVQCNCQGLGNDCLGSSTLLRCCSAEIKKLTLHWKEIEETWSLNVNHFRLHRFKVEFLKRNSHLVFVPGLGHNDPIRNLSKDQFQYGAARRCNVSTCVKWKVTKATKVEHHPAHFDFTGLEVKINFLIVPF